MENIFAIDTHEYYDIFNEIGYAQLHTEFTELELDDWNEEFFTEDHVDTRGKIGKSIGRSIETTRDVAKIYGDVTDGGGEMIYQGVKVGTKALGLGGRILSFIFKLIGLIPKAINAIINKISKTNTKIRHRIQGKIALWVTEKDVEYFERNIMKEIDRYNRLLKTLCDGAELWGEKLNKNDSALIKEMGRIHAKLVTIRYTQTEVSLKNDKSYNTYFASNSSYYSNLQSSIKSFQSYQSFFKELQVQIQDKLSDESSDDLKGRHRAKVQRAIIMINHFAKVIAQYLKYLLEDMKAIDGAINRANKYQDKKNVENGD